MQNLDSSVIATALPSMAESFGADPVRMSTALTAYMLGVAVFIPASGWAADRFGAKHVFLAAIGVFTLSSLLCGISVSLVQLVAARLLQGAGGAMMVPVGRLLLLRATPKSDLVNAMAWLSMPALLGPVLGPPVGGFIVTFVSWRWIFVLNLPVGLLGAVLVALFIEDVRPAAHAALDVFGLVACSTGLALMVAGFETLGRGIVAAWVTLALLAAAAGLFVLYARHMAHIRRPVLEFRLMRVPSFGISVYAGTLFRFGIGALPFLLPMAMQLGLGMSAAASGMITLANGIGSLAMKPAARPVLKRFGFRRTLSVNALLSAAGIALCAVFNADTRLWVLYAVLAGGSFLRSLEFTAFNTLAYADISARRMSQATTLYSTIQQVSLTLGIGVGAGALEAAMHLSGRAAPAIGDFSVAFLVVAALSALALPLCLLLPKDSGAEVSGHRG
ncbi:MAG: MFS transporter [Acetobacteraceae bacterium]|nr:MFS transporter [Acetobacteraceae bacterium]